MNEYIFLFHFHLISTKNSKNIKLLGAVIRKGCIFLKNVDPPFCLKIKKIIDLQGLKKIYFTSQKGEINPSLVSIQRSLICYIFDWGKNEANAKSFKWFHSFREKMVRFVIISSTNSNFWSLRWYEASARLIKSLPEN